MMPPNSAVSFCLLETNRNGEIIPHSNEMEQSTKFGFIFGSNYKGETFEYGEPGPGINKPPTVFLKSGSGFREFDQEMNSLLTGLDNADLGVANQKLEGLLSLSDNRDFDLAASFSATLDTINLAKFGFSGSAGRTAAETVLRAPMQRKELMKNLEKAVEKTMQEYNKDPANNTMTDAQRQNIERAWKTATGEEMSFDDIVAKFKE
jgi:hypothetical protein